MRTSFALLGTIAVLVLSCAPPVSEDGLAIAALSDVWETALNDGDTEALMALYTEDARVMAPNAPMEQGTEAVRAAFGGMIEAGLGGELTTIETRMAGDIGYHVGTYTLAAEGAEVDRGKFIEIWRRDGDGWKISSDIWNSDLAAGHGHGANLIGVHEVDDADKWLAAWRGEDSRHQMFAANGAPHVTVFQSRDQANLTGLAIQVDDMAAFEAFLASPEGQAAAKEDGVRMDTLVLLTAVE